MPKQTSTEFDNALWRLRRQHGLEQKQAAYLLGYRTTDALSRYERGMQQPNLQHAIKLSLLYQATLAAENHRHFALREPKPLRQSPDFLLPFGPWLDGWGQLLVEKGLKPGVFNERDLRDVVVALVSGWKILNTKSIYHSVGYSRALAGVAVAMGAGNLAKGRLELETLVPPVVRKELVEGGLRTLMNTSRAQFEKDWSRKILKLLDF